eukprot:1420920-Amphidinium_carterae.2
MMSSSVASWLRGGRSSWRITLSYADEISTMMKAQLWPMSLQCCANWVMVKRGRQVEALGPMQYCEWSWVSRERNV